MDGSAVIVSVLLEWASGKKSDIANSQNQVWYLPLLLWIAADDIQAGEAVLHLASGTGQEQVVHRLLDDERTNVALCDHVSTAIRT